MTFASFLSDRFAVETRGDWLFELYLTNPQGGQTILRFSRRGSSTGMSAVTIGSDSIAAHTPFRKRVLTVPTFAQSLWQSGAILGRSTPSIGSLILSNMDGGLDQYRPINGWIWAGARFKEFFCDSSPVNLSSSIGKVADGYIGAPTFTTIDVTIPLFGRDVLFGSTSVDATGNPILGSVYQPNTGAGAGGGPGSGRSGSSSSGNPLSVPTSKKVFRGTNYMLELSGVRTVTYGAAGTPATVGIRTSLTLETWIWIDTYPNANVTWWGWTVAANGRPWWVVITATGNVILAAYVAGGVQFVTTVAAISIKTPCHLSIVVSGQSVTFIIWDDDNQTSTVETYPTGFTAATRDALNVTAVYALATANVAVIWHDDMRVWSVARTQSDIESTRFAPFLAGSVPATLVHYTTMDDATGTTVTDSSATTANGTIAGAGTSTWLHSQEGGPELAGTYKPDIWGEKWGSSAVLVDQIHQGYMVAGGKGGIQDIVASYAGGLTHTMDATAASYRAYLTTTPLAGHSLRYLARGLFKLGSVPTKPISVWVKGYSGGSLGYVNTGATVTRDMITRRGPKIVDPTDLDTSSFTSYATANPGIIGLPLYQPVEMASALDQVMLSGGGWWGFKRGLTLFHLEQFAGPSVTSDYNIDQRRIVDLSPLPPSAVIYGVVVRYRHNDVVHSNTDVDGAVLATVGWQQWTLEWQSVMVTDETLRTAYPGNAGVMITIDTLLQYQTDALTLANYLLALLKGYKGGWRVTVDSTGWQITPGQTCTLSVTLQRGSSKRLNLDGTKKYAILSVSDNRQAGTSELEVFG